MEPRSIGVLCYSWYGSRNASTYEQDVIICLHFYFVTKGIIEDTLTDFIVLFLNFCTFEETGFFIFYFLF